jgi:Protein of unknown function (DUF2997)
LKKIKITISKQAKVKIETEGFSGSACQEATKALEKKLGIVTNDTPTAEAFNESENNAQDIA